MRILSPRVRGGPNEEDPVAELLSEHCFTEKCSTSHLGDARGLQELAGWTAAAPERSRDAPNPRLP